MAGTQNSGSTLLDTILGNAPGVWSLGEVGGFHRYTSEPSCDCGEPPASCAPCRAVLASLDKSGDVETLDRLGPLPLKERRAHWAVAGSRARAEYARVADIAFAAVAAETGSSVLVDSSKNVARAAALVHDSRYDVRVLHLVRDGRGYLASRRRRAPMTGRRYVAPVVMAGWLSKNLFISAVLRRQIPTGHYLLCRYEDFVSDPVGELRRIGAFAGVDTTGLAASAMSEGLERHHLFEPRRRANYHVVRIDTERLPGQRLPVMRNLVYWLGGGFISARWGYDRRQSYLDHVAGHRTATVGD
ncbi:MAG TPA: sulfotransferase [Acidimicrobiales bacterium]|nr:sulfotransferase [Acidimicrobiales bacterium]